MTRTETRALEGNSAAVLDAPEHDEWLIDESIQETFPASDPTSPVRPGSTVGLRYAAHGDSNDRALTRARRLGASPFFWIAMGCIASIALIARRRAR